MPFACTQGRRLRPSLASSVRQRPRPSLAAVHRRKLSRHNPVALARPGRAPIQSGDGLSAGAREHRTLCSGAEPSHPLCDRARDARGAPALARDGACGHGFGGRRSGGRSHPCHARQAKAVVEVKVRGENCSSASRTSAYRHARPVGSAALDLAVRAAATVCCSWEGCEYRGASVPWPLKRPLLDPVPMCGSG